MGTETTLKKPARSRKKISPLITTEADLPTAVNGLELSFTQLIDKVTQAKAEFLDLQKSIGQTREAWILEQRGHEFELLQRTRQEELERKREQETYEYETKLKHKQAEDLFLEKRAQWERELEIQKVELVQEKEELQTLRKQVSGLEIEIEKAVSEACKVLEKTLRESFVNEQRIREQEFKSQVEVLNLRLSNLTQENTRQASEIEGLKKAVDEASRQLKDIAVKVIESSGSSQNQPQS